MHSMSAVAIICVDSQKFRHSVLDKPDGSCTAQHCIAQHSSLLACLMKGCIATPVAQTQAPKGISLSTPEASETVTEWRCTAFTFVFKIKSM